MGWPGVRALESAELQARGTWDEALANFATLGAVDARMSRTDALASLRTELASVVFQPETPPAPIQIVGMLEAAGQPFDALWVAGLAAERWPPAPRPNPLLPVEWQRERNVPRASAARELAYATRLTAEFAHAAPEVVFSHATSEDDHPCTPSPLIPAVAEIDDATLAVPASTAMTQFALRVPRECLMDDAAPRLAPGSSLRGGAALVEAQSDCPFKAVAAFRLGADVWPEPIDGLSAPERGMLVHAALASFWRVVRTHAALVELSAAAQSATLDTSIAEAIAAFPANRWRAVSPLVQAGEAARLHALVTNWLDRFERGRPPFEVSAIEAALPLELGGLALRLRLDRIDTLEHGGAAIIDYKTGLVEGADKWFAPRPQAPQLGAYTLAQRAAHPDEIVRAAAYAQLKPGKLDVRGVAADADAWPLLKLPSSLKHADLADWRAVETRWADALGALGAEIIAGVAPVSPRDRTKTCAHCKRQSFCRIGALAIEDRDQDGDD